MITGYLVQFLFVLIVRTSLVRGFGTPRTHFFRCKGLVVTYLRGPFPLRILPRCEEGSVGGDGTRMVVFRYFQIHSFRSRYIVNVSQSTFE